MSTAQIPKIRLGELLIREGLLREEQLQQALTRQKQTGRRLGAVLQDLGFVTDEGIARLLAAQLKFPYFTAVLENVDVRAARKLSELQVRKLRAMPVGQTGDRIRVAVVDPTDWQSVDELPRLLKAEIDIEVIAESGLHALIDRVYSNNENIQGLAKKLSEELKSSEGDAVDFGALGLQAGAEDAPVVKLLQGLFDEAVRVRASDIHIEPMASSVAIRLRVDGHLRPHAEFDLRLAPALASRLKLVAALDISERRLPQDGRFVVQVRNQMVDIRLSTLPSSHGESLVMRLLLKDPMLASLDKLGIPEAGLKRMHDALSQAAGLVLVTGPTGSGKTTTLYAALGALNAAETKILTAEDPVEYRLAGITQVNVNDRIGLGFAQVLRAALRQDPDAILIGEMRDQDTVDTCMRAAVTGHLVLSTLHTNDTASAAARLIDMGAAPYMVGMALQLVIAQRLVRRVCSACAAPAEPSIAQRAWLDAQLGRHGWDATGLKHGRGCTRCRSTGYEGRLGLYEVLGMNEDLVGALMKNDMAGFLSAARQALADQQLPVQAARAVTAGHTTVDEAMRIGVRAL
ncbi:MAG: Flp pilus assembly complex ATPase component TadA [Rubrivivax sp.]|nr:Flp pilus assembly complex ATPase component TadA [Rubrivivax sp.]